jgi:hypothetical protein
MSGPGSSEIDIDKLCAIACALYMPDDGAWNVVLVVIINCFFISLPGTEEIKYC